MTLAEANVPIILLIVGAGLVLIPLIWLIAVYNRFASVRQHLKESWADIDVELKRRHDLIPNLVETVKGYAAHERGTLARVVELRNRAAERHASAAALAADESSLLIELRRLFAVAESYPRLRADAHFMSLQQELAMTEDRIAAARRFYNANVRELNQLCATFPTNVVASMFGFKPETFFELSSEAERVVPRVNTSSMTQPGYD